MKYEWHFVLLPSFSSLFPHSFSTSSSHCRLTHARVAPYVHSNAATKTNDELLPESSYQVRNYYAPTGVFDGEFTAVA